MSDEETKPEELSDATEVAEPDLADSAAEPVVAEPEHEPEPEAAAEPEPEDAPEIEPGAEPVPVPEPEPAPEAQPVSAVFEAELLEPPRKHTGLIVVVASLVLLLAAFVFIGPFLYKAVFTATSAPTSSVAPSKAKITIAIGFVEALLNGDTLAIKPFLQDNAQKAITDAQWKLLAAQDATPAVTFAAPTWTGDTKADVKLSAQDTTGTLTFTIDPAKPLTVLMSADIGGTAEHDTVILVQAGSDWRVLSISNGTDTTTFDATLVKSMVSTDTPQ
jgi:hypothetical protein